MNKSLSGVEKHLKALGSKVEETEKMAKMNVEKHNWHANTLSQRPPPSARENAEPIRPREVAGAAQERGDVDVLGVLEGFQFEVLQDGDQEEEKLHAGEALPCADPFLSLIHI